MRLRQTKPLTNPELENLKIPPLANIPGIPEQFIFFPPEIPQQMPDAILNLIDNDTDIAMKPVCFFFFA